MITPDTNNPIAVTVGTVGTAILRGQTVSVVNARDLHAALGSQKKFADWIKAQIERCGLIDGLEWSKGDLLAQKGEQEGLLPQKVKQSGFASPAGEEARGGHNKTEYILTIDAAKQVAMSSNTPRGRDVRLYFIECERLLSIDQQRQANETADRLAVERVAAEAAQAARATVEATTKPAPQQITLTKDERLILQSCRESSVILAECLKHVQLCGGLFKAEPDWLPISNLAMAGLSATEIEEETKIDRSLVGRAISEMVSVAMLNPKQLKRARTLALRANPIDDMWKKNRPTTGQPTA